MMTLTVEDVDRLAALGHRGFYRETADGALQLVNRHGRCVFLRGSQCVVYDDRPEGCRLYPLILDRDIDRAVKDDFCPHGGEFEFGPEDESRLRNSVATEDTEAEEREAEGRKNRDR
jgi:Fe-S-cluster containining protein